MTNQCVRAKVVPEPCGECEACRKMREEMIEGISKGMRLAGRDPQPGMVVLRKLPLLELYRLFDYWGDTGPKHVW